MKYQLEKYLTKFIKTDEINVKDISSAFCIKNYKKDTLLLKKGNICEEVYFINKGAMRTFICNKEREYTRMIGIENNFVGNLSSFRNSTASNENIETLENTECLAINKDDMYKLMEEKTILKDVYIDIIEQFNFLNQFKINKILLLNDKEKVTFYFKHYKKYTLRFSDRINASFLNMSRENYSRYKKYVKL